MTPIQLYAACLFCGLLASWFVANCAAAMVEHCCEGERE
jgi:hypothetical protein